MTDLIFLFPLLFIGMFIAASYLLSRKGWSDLAEKYRYDGEFEGENIGIISASINGVNFKNSLILKYNQDGFYLKPLLLFRLFQKPIFIPWKEVKDVRDKKFLFFPFTELVIGDPAVAIMQLKSTTFARMERAAAMRFSVKSE